MKRHFYSIALFAALAAATNCAQAKRDDGNPEACFPACEPDAPIKSNDAGGDDASVPVPGAIAPASKTCEGGTRVVQHVEKLNAQIEPDKDLVGYVRSPQGLAVKLVNDHLFKIPGWVGFALDPVGTLKQKAIDEARSRAKDLLKSDDEACKARPDTLPDLSIDAS